MNTKAKVLLLDSLLFLSFLLERWFFEAGRRKFRSVILGGDIQIHTFSTVQVAGEHSIQLRLIEPRVSKDSETRPAQHDVEVESRLVESGLKLLQEIGFRFLVHIHHFLRLMVPLSVVLLI